MIEDYSVTAVEFVSYSSYELMPGSQWRSSQTNQSYRLKYKCYCEVVRVLRNPWNNPPRPPRVRGSKVGNN